MNHRAYLSHINSLKIYSFSRYLSTLHKLDRDLRWRHICFFISCSSSDLLEGIHHSLHRAPGSVQISLERLHRCHICFFNWSCEVNTRQGGNRKENSILRNYGLKFGSGGAWIKQYYSLCRKANTFSQWNVAVYRQALKQDYHSFILERTNLK